MISRILPNISNIVNKFSLASYTLAESERVQQLNAFEVNKNSITEATDVIIDRSKFIASLIPGNELVIEVSNPDLKIWQSDRRVKGEFNRNRQYRDAEITLARALKQQELGGDVIDKIFIAEMLEKDLSRVLSDNSINSLSTYAKALSLLLDSELRSLQNQLPSAWEEFRSQIRYGSHDRRKLLSALGTFVPNEFCTKVFGGDPFETDTVLKQPIKPESWGFVPSSLNSVIAQLTYLQNLKDIENATFADLGCGTGNVALLAYLCLTKNVIGVDYGRYPLSFAEKFSKFAGISGIEWREEDVLKTDLKEMDCIYSYSPFRSSEMIGQFTHRLLLASIDRPIVIAASYYDLIRSLEESNCLRKLKEAKCWTIFCSLGHSDFQ